ncbi:MAG TPA: hypothetical protein DDZ42_20735, partial [Candidatus Rokubacteria bacterium]|nr:hypothetical protein [Candidatus Rokubacteria bacterium]
MWFYLGKDLRTRRRLGARLGAERRAWLGDRLHAAARELRQPFLDFVARVGAVQSDRIAWWSTTFSWKVWGASDVFLLICYLIVAERLVEDAVSRKEPILIVVEDPWLLRQMRDNWAGNANVQFHGVPSLVLVKARAVLLGLVRRAAWAFRMVRHYWRQRRVWPRATLQAPVKPTAGIYTYPQRRSLRGETGWADPYLPGLDEIFRDVGYDVIRFSAPQCDGLEQELAVRHRDFRPLILYASAAGFWRSLRAVWWPRWPGRLEVAGR